MAEQLNSDTPDLATRLAEKSVKTMEKHVEEQTTMKLQGGQSPTEILQGLLGAVGKPDVMGTFNQVNQLASQEMPIPGTMQGPSAIMSLIQGKGFNPLAPHTKSLGMDSAIALTKLANEQAKMPGEMQKNNMEVISGLLKYAKDTGNKELFTALSGQQVPETAIETDPMTGDPTEKGLAQKSSAEAKGRKTGEIEIARQQFGKDFNIYMQLAEQISSKEGFANIGGIPTPISNALINKLGLDIQSSTLGGQITPESKAYAQLKVMNNYLTPTIRRLSGDVGNATVWEQQAAGKLLLNGDETTGLKQLKLATLSDLSRAFNTKDEGKVRKVIQSFMKNKMVTAKYGEMQPKEKKLMVDKNGNKAWLLPDGKTTEPYKGE